MTEPMRTTRTALDKELEKLHGAEAQGLRKFLTRSGIPVADAEELANDVFLAVYRAMQTKAGALDVPRAYLYRVASNMLRGYRRTNRQRRPHLDRMQQMERADARLDKVDDTSHIDDRDELTSQSALDALPARQREAFLLRFYCEFFPAEIAGVMGISVNAVDTHLERARHKLADMGKEAAS